MRSLIDFIKNFFGDFFGDFFGQVFRADWSEVSTPKAVGFCVGLGILFLVILTSHQGWVYVLDDANLAFHEAGHPIFGIFGETAQLYGGTLGQLAFPAICTTVFWFRRHAFSYAVCGVWFFENFLNISRYMADARERALPLVGGGDHDWAIIFRRWGVLASDVQIAGAVKVIGWIGMLAFAAWIYWTWWKGRRSRSVA